MTRMSYFACKIIQRYYKHMLFCSSIFPRHWSCSLSVAQQTNNRSKLHLVQKSYLSETPRGTVSNNISGHLPGSPTPARVLVRRGLITFGCSCIFCAYFWFQGNRRFASNMADKGTAESSKHRYWNGKKKDKRKKTENAEVSSDKRRTRESVVAKERDRFVNMPQEEKRDLYKCGRKFKTVDDIPTWTEYFSSMSVPDKPAKKSKGEKQPHLHQPAVSDKLNSKVSIWRGDITQLEIDAIVNAANRSLMGGGGVDGAIHAAAGGMLRRENETHKGCDTGDVKLSAGYKLPAKYVISTVGPVGEKPSQLRSCYSKSLQLLNENNLRHVAFPCISTGVYGYPNEKAAQVALGTVRNWLQSKNNADSVERVIFCLFLPSDVEIYERLMQVYFPLSSTPASGESEATSQTDDVTDKPAITEELTTGDDITDKPAITEELATSQTDDVTDKPAITEELTTGDDITDKPAITEELTTGDDITDKPAITEELTTGDDITDKPAITEELTTGDDITDKPAITEELTSGDDITDKPAITEELTTGDDITDKPAITEELTAGDDITDKPAITEELTTGDDVTDKNMKSEDLTTTTGSEFQDEGMKVSSEEVDNQTGSEGKLGRELSGELTQEGSGQSSGGVEMLSGGGGAMSEGGGALSEGGGALSEGGGALSEGVKGEVPDTAAVQQAQNETATSENKADEIVHL